MLHHHFEPIFTKNIFLLPDFLESVFEIFQRLIDFEENSWIMASLEQGLYIGIV